MDVGEAKAAVGRAVDGLAGLLKATSREIHDNPEVGLREFRAAALLSGLLEKAGFDVERGVAGLETSFVATWPRGNGPSDPRGGATVALVAEYDALPGIGHGCGHNIIGTAAVGAGLALASVWPSAGQPGRVLVVGAPAEEGGVDGAGGKVFLVEAGVFDGVDAALMVHPGTVDAPTGQSLYRQSLEIAFKGRAAHAAGAPQEGLNALEGVIQTFNAINALRQHLPPTVRVHGIVVRGGEAPNIVPEDGLIRLYVRAASRPELEDASVRVRNCARGAALATGCQVTFREFARTYEGIVVNAPLEDVFARNMEALGRPLVRPADEMRGMGSTDMGNVSRVVPAIHPYVAIGDRTGGPPSHSREFAAATVLPRGEQALIVATKALAMTCLDLLLSPETLEVVRRAGPNRGERRSAS